MNAERAEEMLAFLRDYIQTEGMAPSVREICEGTGIRSTSTVHRYLHDLEQQGKIRMLAGKNRAITVTDYVEFLPSKHYDGELFALRVRGESMINVGIYDGDIVIVEKTPVAENGEIVVALVDHSEATVKTFYKEDRHYRLQPENDEMEPIIVDEVEILGKVVSLIRYF